MFCCVRARAFVSREREREGGGGGGEGVEMGVGEEIAGGWRGGLVVVCSCAENVFTG